MIFRRWWFSSVFKHALFVFFNFQDDYRAWDIRKSELYKQEQTYYPPTVKLRSTATFQDDCVPCEIKPRQSFKPSPAVKCSTVPLMVIQVIALIMYLIS